MSLGNKLLCVNTVDELLQSKGEEGLSNPIMSLKIFHL